MVSGSGGGGLLKRFGLALYIITGINIILFTYNLRHDVINGTAVRSSTPPPAQGAGGNGGGSPQLQEEVNKVHGENEALDRQVSSLQNDVAELRRQADTEKERHAAALKAAAEKAQAQLDTVKQQYRKEGEEKVAEMGRKLEKSGHEQRPWLTIGIPTVPRPHNDDRLGPTIESIKAQITGGFQHSVQVVVMNSARDGQQHEAFQKVYRKYHDQKWIRFVTNPNKYPDDKDKEFAAEFEGTTKEQPTDRVRRQTLDVVNLLDASAGLSEYFLFYEDDFYFCPNAMLAIQYMIARADLYQGKGKWAAIRCSFGLNGILMHNDEPHDVKTFRNYLLRHFNRRPPDHLVVEWYAKESEEARKYFGPHRHVMAFRYNIARHEGRHSTLREESPWSTPGCFTELIAPQVFPVEAWNPVDCPEDDIWPCDNPHRSPSQIVWNNNSAAHVSNNRIIYVQKGGHKDGG